MTLNLLNMTVTPAAKNVGRGGEDKAARVARMQAFFQADQNKAWVPVGKFLSIQVAAGVTLAAHLVANAGESFPMETITLPTGEVLPLQAGFAIGLPTLKSWDCPACSSAHGTGVAPSPALSADLLEENQFFYNVATKELRVFSNSCRRDYVKALGFGMALEAVPVRKAKGSKATTPVAA